MLLTTLIITLNVLMSLTMIPTLSETSLILKSEQSPSMTETRRSDNYHLKESKITALKPLKETGMTITEFDSTALRENISLSFAELLDSHTSLYIKQYGRATQATVSFRGTSPSHTQVLWNGLPINSPMMGMTDFSMIPSYFADKASILHGTSSLETDAGGIGGAVVLNTAEPQVEGWDLQYIQGIGSFHTADEFLRFSYKGPHFSSSTRAILSTSRNDFVFVNYDKNEIEYDENMNIVNRWHPREEQDNARFRDFHLLQEFYGHTNQGDNLKFSAWYTNSMRQIPKISVDYSDNIPIINETRDNILKMAAGWDRSWEASKASVNAGWIMAHNNYDYARDNGVGTMIEMIRSRCKSNSIFLKAGYNHYWDEVLMLEAQLEGRGHFIDNHNYTNSTGYKKGRGEMSAYLALRWHPNTRFGLAMAIRENLYGKKFSFPMPSLNLDLLLVKSCALYLKASVSKNYRYPTMNDMYFIPGGNPELRPESGLTYDVGYSLKTPNGKRWQIQADGGWFDSYIDDWILWIPEGGRRDFYTPRNVSKVHAYGIEQNLSGHVHLGTDWTLGLNGSFTWSPSLNLTPNLKGSDSFGKQLPYTPEFSASINAWVNWRDWSLKWKWTHYSKRFTMTSNEDCISGSIQPYFMNDLSLSKSFSCKHLDIDFSFALKNIFNEHYTTVLVRPMPGINYEVFIGLRPKWRKR